jgi:hypothetical protein
MVVLGISTNTRRTGVAIIERDMLVDYFLHSHPQKWCKEKIDAIVVTLDQYVNRYHITNIALTIPYDHHQTNEFLELIAHLKKWYKKNNISVLQVSMHAIHSLYQTGAKKAKKELMHALVAIYPELTLCFKKELHNRSRYYIKVFEAVGAIAYMNTVRNNTG